MFYKINNTTYVSLQQMPMATLKIFIALCNYKVFSLQPPPIPSCVSEST